MRNKHHRWCKSNGGGSGRYKGQKFVVNVDMNNHIARHKIFGNMTPQEIVIEINKRWLDPRFELQLKER